ncbi:hypothetical protein [Roseovarius sp. M141]|uniref:hypothetical protein n=1 Tax=Roseovarius sp. M141 TaxID=2583806 RepID=UPI0020CC69EC|nr:hypothetical protein [Roseovarius sp. M141]MCQ0092268.1 hypothetical protein [Roseovarius sp. M141]
MSALRDEIRSILREEIAALRSQIAPRRAPERVQIGGSADLDRFARDLLMRAQNDPDFAAAVTSGAQRFELSGAMPAPANTCAPRIVTGPASPTRTKAAELTKTLVTERDIEALDKGAKVLRVPKQCRLTPLANDEARRRGIRIERFAT